MTTEYASQFVADPLPFARLAWNSLPSPRSVEAVLQVREDLCTRPAVLHGGAVMALADTLGAIATVANLAEGATTHYHRKQNKLLRRHPGGDTARAECTPCIVAAPPWCGRPGSRAAMGESRRWSSRRSWCCRRRGSPKEEHLWTCMSILE